MEGDESGRNVYIPSPSDIETQTEVPDKLKVTNQTDSDDASGDAKYSTKDDLPVIECPVCLQPCVHPVQLPCSHVFCFLCVKGVANRSKRCALCRQEIPLAYFHNPKLICQEELVKTAAFEDGYQWFYEGRNGWWQYDERTSTDLEDKYKEGEKSFELLIAGFLYVIDLDSMLQYRRNDPTRRRRIKRDLENIPEKKGVAGLRVVSNPNARQGAYGVETSSGGKGQPSPAGDGQSDGTGRLGAVHVTPPTPHNTPQDSQSPATPRLSASGLSAVMQDLHLSHSGDGRSTSPDHSVNTNVQIRNSIQGQTDNLHTRGHQSLSSSPTSPPHMDVSTSQRTRHSPSPQSTSPLTTAVATQRNQNASPQTRNPRVSPHSQQSGRERAEGSSSVTSVTNSGNQPVSRIQSASIQSATPPGVSTHMDSDVRSRANERRSRHSERKKSPNDHSS